MLEVKSSHVYSSRHQSFSWGLFCHLVRYILNSVVSLWKYNSMRFVVTTFIFHSNTTSHSTFLLAISSLNIFWKSSLVFVLRYFIHTIIYWNLFAGKLLKRYKTYLLYAKDDGPRYRHYDFQVGGDLLGSGSNGVDKEKEKENDRRGWWRFTTATRGVICRGGT